MDLRALIFVPALAGSVILGFVFLLFAAHYYLTVLEGTAAGAKQIPWIPQPILDNFTKVFYLLWLVGLWAGPAYLIGRAVAPTEPWLKLAVPLVFMWLLYPVSQLSSLSATSIWVPINLDVFTRLLQKPGVTLAFFLLTLPVVALGGVAFKWAFLTKGEFPLLFLGVPILMVTALLYSRMLGRLAFALMFTRNLLKRKKKKKPKAEVAPRDEQAEEAEVIVQPTDLLPINTPDGELAGYNVLIADDEPKPKKRVKAAMAEDPEPAPDAAPTPAEPEPPRPQKRNNRHPLDRARTWTDEDDDATPYSMNAADGLEPERETLPPELQQPRADEMALLDRSDVVKPPKRVWTAELFAFLPQPGTISALLVMTLTGTLAGVMVRVARAFDPTVGGE
jgi:hypothetical protein